METSTKKLNACDIEEVDRLTSEWFKDAPFVKTAYKNIDDFYKLAKVTAKYCSEFGEVNTGKKQGKIVGAGGILMDYSIKRFGENNTYYLGNYNEMNHSMLN